MPVSENIKEQSYISSKEPKSFFFTVPTDISQDASQAYGPVLGNENNRFRLTSKFSCAAPVPAYAICKGAVLVQPQSGNSDRVNVVLRPYTQPLQGIQIKYFVYRGLDKNDFIDGNNVKANSSGSSEFVTKINEEFTSFYTQFFPSEPVPDFLASYIGYGNQPNGLLLTDFFFKNPSSDAGAGFELPLIDGGKSLGNFFTGVCGIDVVLEYGNYYIGETAGEFIFDLAYARASEAIIDVTSETDAYLKKIKREQVNQFLDIAAYYGFHYSDKGFVTSQNVKKTKDQIYIDLIQNFITKNKLYLYIQSDRGRSYNFYENYLIESGSQPSLKTGITEAALAATAFETNGWPLLIDETTQAHTETNNSIYLQLVTDNNVNTMLYGQAAQIENAQKNNFCDADNLRQPPDENGNESIFTKAILLSNPATDESGQKKNIASFNLLLYQGKAYSYVAGQIDNGQGGTTDVFATPNFFDDVFDLIDASPLTAITSNSAYTIMNSQRLKLINYYYNQRQQGIAAVQTLVINDIIDTGLTNPATLSRVTYITEALNVLNNAASVLGSISSNTQTAPSISAIVGATKTYNLPDSFYYTIQIFTDSSQTIKGLRLHSNDGTIPNKIILGLSKQENELLKSLISSADKNPRIFLIDLFEDGNELISPENFTYQKYKVGIVNEQDDGLLKFFLNDPPVIAYSIDRRYHFSKSYSEYSEDQLMFFNYTIERSV